MVQGEIIFNSSSFRSLMNLPDSSTGHLAEAIMEEATGLVQTQNLLDSVHTLILIYFSKREVPSSNSFSRFSFTRGLELAPVEDGHGPSLRLRKSDAVREIYPRIS